ncbi:hypothetical protein Vretimale_2905 [Volvox reticuliferus]|uniref:Uncharacterized protein n=1 Tax=Volvox reticuliferus TaxID=1737510 RepID=A0A8J4DD12_9CHLO|nr:hypothetical protein Vretimale_2905 [Volvox reticuliferus]
MGEASGLQTVAAPVAEAPTARNSRLKTYLKLVWDLICEHWFILGLCFAIGFAAAVPNFGRKGGWIAAQWTIKYGAVIIIFLLSGLSLKTRALFTVMARLHVHLFIQFICLVLTPAIGYGFARAMMESSTMNRDLANGLVVAMTMPTTISTNVVFTKQSGGNEPVALVNAVLGNIIGIFVSPAWLYLYLGKSGQAPYADVIKQMAITIIAPLIVGQIVQYIFPNPVKKAQEKVNFGKIGNLMIILLVWNTFCDTFHRKIHLEAKSWVPMLFLEIGLFLLFSAMCLTLATFVPFKRVFGFDKPDAVAVLMCGSTKTLALGMPLITVLYGKHSSIGVISLPLIIYHASQCLIGSLYIKQLKKWVDGPQPGAWPASSWHTGDLGDTGPGKVVRNEGNRNSDSSGSPSSSPVPLRSTEPIAPVAVDTPQATGSLVRRELAGSDVERGESAALVVGGDSASRASVSRGSVGSKRGTA